MAIKAIEHFDNYEIREFRNKLHFWATQLFTKEIFDSFEESRKLIDEFKYIKRNKDYYLNNRVDLITKIVIENLYLNQHKTNKEITNILGYSNSMINRLLNNFTKEKNHDHNFFSEERESPEQFFWVGFLLYQSSIIQDKNTLRVTSKDKSIIEKFVDTGICYNAKINFYEYSKVFGVSLVSRHILKDLNNRFGINSDKYYFKFSDELIKHRYFKYFLKGRLNPFNSLERKKEVEISGSEEFLTSLNELLVNDLGVMMNGKVRKRIGKENVSRFYLGANSINKILDYCKD